MAVDPRGEDLKRFVAEDVGGPVVMLNLLRYAPDGRHSYGEYARSLESYLAGIGAEVVYAGDCSTVLVAPPSHHWDAVLLVRYPSRGTFSAMVADPDYQRITHYRTRALADAVLQATVPW